MADNTYRGWTISFDYPPIPCRDFDWSATSPDFDADCDGTGFHCCSGHHLTAATLKDLLEAINECIAENEETLTPNTP